MKYHQLAREQRYAIYLGLQAGDGIGAIARRIEVNKSTVSRELSRNKNRFGKYGWYIADEKARERRERMPGNRALHPCIVREALSLLRTEDWSPAQISGYMRLRGKGISHESIYSLIRSDASGELCSHCRHRMKYRRHMRVSRKTRGRNIPGRVSIHERPPRRRTAGGSGTGRWT